ncbi:MAG: hypothetical protein KDA61_22790, partial [Planctomycetales bacterium]|nr:hypothetical protein [Planctomycetales bacterium]
MGTRRHVWFKRWMAALASTWAVVLLAGSVQGQALSPAAPHPIWGVDSAAGRGCGEVGWESRGCVNWQAFAQGEYVGHARLPHVPEYRLRVDDQ